MHARKLAELAFELVPPNRAEPELRHHDGNAHMSEIGVESFDVEQSRANTISGPQQPLDIGGARYSACARKAELSL